MSLRIGEWTVEPAQNELLRDGKALRLEPKVVEVLVQLAARPGKVATREELLARVWPDVVVGDDALTQAIIKLRKALGDDAQEPRYIETIPKRGYRLIAPVRNDADPSGAGPAPDPHAKKRQRASLLLVGLALALLVGLAVQQLKTRPWPLAEDVHKKAPAASFPLVAVLPLANLSGDAKRDYLSDGITEDIIGALGRFSGVRVMSWNAVQAFRGKEPSAQAVRESLLARYIVQGSLREGAGAIRIAVELSDAENGTQLWSERYDAEGARLLQIQDRIVRDVVGALAVKLTDLEQQRAATVPAENAQAYDLLLRARALRRMDQRAANREARALIARVQKLAPDYADAWVLLGEAEWDRAAFGWVESPEDSVRRAEEYARKALESQDSRAHAKAHSLLATLKTHVGRPEEALMHTSRAIALNPSDASTLFRQGHALLALGRIDEAISTIEGAMRYEPRPQVGPHYQLATAYYLAGRYRDAVNQIDLVNSARPPGGEGYALRAAALAQLGELDAARESAEEVRRRNPHFRLEEAGTRLRNPEHAARLREGLAKAGL